MKSTIGTATEAKVELVNFGANDKRGRAIGAEIRTREIDFVALPEGACAWYNIEAGHYFEVVFHTTRDGRTYGPIQPRKHFKTEAERKLEIERYLKYAERKAKGGK